MTAISIDGPSGAGKSTIAKRLAEELGFSYLDTGAMYRGMTYLAIEKGIDLDDEEAVCRMTQSAMLRYEGQDLYVDDLPAEPHIRSEAVTRSVSLISSYGCVREKMVAMQRMLADEGNIVLDGRDIGTTVLPKADFKFYLTASPEVRARRRYLENKEKSDLSYEQVLEDILRRDKYDSNRAISPLRVPEDAHQIDSSELNIEQVVQIMRDRIRGK
ncbi:MAG: (d)CMP kinase [Tissierellia bacterium]|nr:(d)CMP kinase [Tissierellia bacterium]